MKVLLTGGAGFIGSHVAEGLLGRGDQVMIVDNLNDFYDPRIKLRNLASVREKGKFLFYKCDIRDREALNRIFHSERPETVVHLAAYAGVRPSLQDPALCTDVNVTGTVHLLEEARLSGVRHFVFGSSSSVYGTSNSLPFQEDDAAFSPASPYAVTKRAGELMCRVYHQNYGLACTCLRFFTVYGPRQRPEMAIHKFTCQIDQGREVTVYDEGRSKRDYTYIDDILQGTVASLDRPSGFQIFNLGNSQTTSLLELISMIEQALGKAARIKLLPSQPGDVPITCADISRAQQYLGYTPGTGISEGISRFVNWYSRNKRSDSQTLAALDESTIST
ncbi:MAG: GDP-mannose 4,6-dehydratase [Acidobacteria bacterium]|nr:GDP-mannose 4,6-dehydratase [Acidobacteriota bacterium]